ncbi:GATOR complex protein WDR24 isoform X2 [Argonauta hians]
MDLETVGSFRKMETEKVRENSAMSIQHCVQEQINAIALNRDSNQVVIAGRQVFKIFSIGDDNFEEKANFRVGKNITLNYSAADVTWNHNEENKIASAATNSSVVVWDLQKSSRSKLYNVYTAHKRTVHRVTFHNKEPALLLSGSQDGDMKIFDIRRKEVSMNFSAKESVRDVQFCPQSSGSCRFAAGLENGIVQEWDIRRPDRPEREITAHTGPVFTLDWNTMDKNWLATGGRDRAIKVWDMPSKKLVHVVHTMASVARCKWRPEYKYLIASSSLLVDFAVNIWDIRRPYIPLAAFNRHKDVASGIQWRNSPNILLSCGRDGYLYQNIFKEAQRPLEHINRVGVNISNNGDVAQAVCEHLLKPYREQIPEIHEPVHQFNFDEVSTSSPSSLCHLLQSVEPYMWASSNLYVFSSDMTPDLSMDWFIHTAKMYKLNGKSFEDICDHNASVAQKLNRKQVYLTWMILKTLYSSSSPSNLTPPYHSGPGYSALSDKPDSEKTGKIADATPEKSCEVEKDNPLGENTSGCSEEESDAENEVQEKNLANIATGLASQTGDFFFGEGDTDFSYDLEDADSVLHDKHDWSLPAEAFQPRHELEFSNAPPVPPAHYSPANDSDGNSFQATNSNHREANSNDAAGAGTDLYINVKLPLIPQWDCSSLVTDMLVSYAEEDIQSTVSMLIVLGDRIHSEIDLEVRTSWFLSYIELLGQFKLWSVIADVIKLSKIPEVSMLNQQSSNILTMCHRCNKTLTNCSWFCNKCRTVVGVCSVCYQPAKHLFVWCQGCGHGGHLQHIMDWFRENKQCPRGCGHYCEYS